MRIITRGIAAQAACAAAPLILAPVASADPNVPRDYFPIPGGVLGEPLCPGFPGGPPMPPPPLGGWPAPTNKYGATPMCPEGRCR